MFRIHGCGLLFSFGLGLNIVYTANLKKPRKIRQKARKYGKIGAK